jgi:ferredoxin
MKINENRCVVCKKCIPHCPVRAIKIDEKRVIIDQDACVECGTCQRSNICDVDAHVPMNVWEAIDSNSLHGRVLAKTFAMTFRFIPFLYDLREPRYIRAVLSDPTTSFFKCYGRGTEEVKTNDITGRYDWGEIGFCIEVGRPGAGTTMMDVERFTTAIADLGVRFELKNPITWLMKNEKGFIKERYLKERVLSAIIEFSVTDDNVAKVFRLIRDLDDKCNTVFTVGVISPMTPEGNIPVLEKVEENGFAVSPHSKINLGLAKNENRGESR